MPMHSLQRKYLIQRGTVTFYSISLQMLLL